MRTLLATLAAMLALAVPLGAQAGPADDLAKAKAEIAASHNYSADGLLQKVVKAPDASRAQVEEALYLQSMIYYADIFGASLVLPSITAVAQQADPFGADIAQQLVLARRAFSVAAGAYLNITAAGHALQKVQVDLPPFTEEDITKIQGALSSRPTVQAVIKSYGTNPSEGKGLLARANQFGLYLGFASAVPKTKDRKMADVRTKLKAGANFDKLRHLDWLASVCIDMSKMARDPQGPDMLALSKRADERLLKLAGKDESSQFVKNAKARLKKYGGG